MRNLLKLLLLAGAAVGATACGGADTPEAMTPASRPSEEQGVVNRAASVVEAMRSDEDFRGLDRYLARAKGVIIFPSLTKAAFVVGGQGGTGVLLARTEQGWSPPAFYRLTSGSAGLQIGYQRGSAILVLMSRSALEDALDGGFTLGADATVTMGTIGDAAAEASTTVSEDVVQFMDVGGAFVGASLSGAAIRPRDDYNAGYYAPGASPRAIVLERRYEHPGARPLAGALRQ